MSAIAIPRGETVYVLNVDGRQEPYMVLAPCDHRMIGYYCETHRQHLANAGNLAMHLEAEGEHRVVVWCGDPKCRVYREADAAQLAALDPHQLLLPESQSDG